MPKETPQLTITLDADHLARLAKNAAEFMEGQSKPLRLQFTTGDSAVRMDCPSNHEGQEWTAILMPMRGSAYRNAYEADPTPNPFKDVPAMPDDAEKKC
jgi:hypothetical protein